MATAPPVAMEMPQQGANPLADPNTMAVYDQLRQTTSPKAFGDEMLAGASLVDSEAVAKFIQKLQGLDIPPEVLDALNNVVDEILANPERYGELRAKYMGQGLPANILPEQFDPQFFVALNMAIDQMIAAPSGVQSFARGGIAGLKPIAKVIASYGRNGDTMLAHITPAEARMLRRRGGSGTINPDTGLPEFFFDDIFGGIGDALGGIGDALGDAISGIGDAVQDFVDSDVGKMVTTVALGYFLGPVVAAQFGVSSAVGVAAISGFVGSAGSTLLGGGDIGDALKAGAIGGLTAGAGAGIMGGSGAFTSGSYTGPTTVSGQFDRLTNFITPNAAPVIDPKALVKSTGPNIAPVPVTNASQLPVNAPSGGSSAYTSQAGPALSQVNNVPAPGTNISPEVVANKPPSTMFEKATDFYNKNISPSGIQEAGRETAMTKTLAQFPNATAEQVINAPATSVLGKAYQDALPGVFSTYAPITGVGLGALAAFGGFETKPVQSGPITKSLMKPVTQRIAEDGTQRQMYSQGLPGVVYDEYGAPVFGKSVRLPTYDVPDYNSSGYGLAQQGINLPPVYIPPPGTIGSRRVEQPYNNADMYSNLVSRGYDDGGEVSADNPLSPNDDNLIMAAEKAKQEAARNAVAQQKALRRSQGSGQMYSNINAGLAALAPETNPMYAGPVGDLFRNILRRDPGAVEIANYRAAYGDTVDEQERADFERNAAPEIAARNNFVGEAPYQTFGMRNRAAGLAGLQTAYGPMLQNQQDAMAQQAGILSNRGSSALAMPFNTPFGMPVPEQPFPIPRYTNAGRSAFMNMGGIAGLAQGGYPRRTGQISGPGTEKSDDIPAMLSDGEFVMTAKAVRGAGKGSRRAGAKKMYALMHQLEKNLERG